MVVAQPQGDPAISEDEGYVTLKTPKASARVRLSDGAVSFLDADGKAVLTESARGAFTPETIEGQRYVTVNQQFNRGTGEGFYGPGQHPNGQLDYKGDDVEPPPPKERIPNP